MWSTVENTIASIDSMSQEEKFITTDKRMVINL